MAQWIPNQTSKKKLRLHQNFLAKHEVFGFFRKATETDREDIYKCVNEAYVVDFIDILLTNRFVSLFCFFIKKCFSVGKWTLKFCQIHLKYFSVSEPFFFRLIRVRLTLTIIMYSETRAMADSFAAWEVIYCFAVFLMGTFIN